MSFVRCQGNADRGHDRWIGVDQGHRGGDPTAGRYVRADFYSSGGKTRIYVATITDGSVSTHKNKVVSSGSVPTTWLRVNRSGDTWNVSYSFDGSSWTEWGGSASGAGVSTTPNSSAFPRLAIGSFGTPAVAWSERGSSNNTLEIYLKAWR